MYQILRIAVNHTYQTDFWCVRPFIVVGKKVLRKSAFRCNLAFLSAARFVLAIFFQARVQTSQYTTLQISQYPQIKNCNGTLHDVWTHQPESRAS